MSRILKEVKGKDILSCKKVFFFFVDILFTITMRHVLMCVKTYFVSCTFTSF